MHPSLELCSKHSLNGLLFLHQQHSHEPVYWSIVHTFCLSPLSYYLLVPLPSRLQLATLHVQLGMIDDALMVLESDPSTSRDELQGEQENEDEGPLLVAAINPLRKDPGEQVWEPWWITDKDWSGGLTFCFSQLSVGSSSIDTQIQVVGEQRKAEGVCGHWLWDLGILLQGRLQQAGGERWESCLWK